MVLTGGKKKVKKAGGMLKPHRGSEHRDCLDEFLCSVPAFFQASNEALHEIKKLLTKKHIRRGKAVYLSGDPVTNLYIAESGKIEISKTDEQGRRLTLWYIKPSEVFCVPSVLTGQAIADAEAAEDSALYCLAREDFEGLLVRYPELAVGLLRCLAGRVRSYSKSVDSVAFNSAANRIAGILLAYHAKGAADELICSLSRNEIISLTGTCRETVSRALNKFKKDNIITMERRKIVILDIEELKRRLSPGL